MVFMIHGKSIFYEFYKKVIQKTDYRYTTSYSESNKMYILHSSLSLVILSFRLQSDVIEEQFFDAIHQLWPRLSLVLWESSNPTGDIMDYGVMASIKKPYNPDRVDLLFKTCLEMAKRS